MEYGQALAYGQEKHVYVEQEKLTMARKRQEGEVKSHQQHLLMAPSEVDAIDDWAFRHRLRSRGEAIRRLCQVGIVFDTKIIDAIFGMNAAIEAAGRISRAFDDLDDVYEQEEVTELPTDIIMTTVLDAFDRMEAEILPAYTKLAEAALEAAAYSRSEVEVENLRENAEKRMAEHRNELAASTADAREELEEAKKGKSAVPLVFDLLRRGK